MHWIQDCIHGLCIAAPMRILCVGWWDRERCTYPHSTVRIFPAWHTPPAYTRTLARRKRISAITAAISSEGLLGVELTYNSVDSDKFFDFIRGTLIPNMQPFDGSNSKSIVIMDNCSIHHVEPVKELLQDAGILLIFLPPYSPDYNPIEETFSSIKYYLKDHDEILQTLQEPDVMTIVKAAFDNVTAQDCNSWITDCGYA